MKRNFYVLSILTLFSFSAFAQSDEDVARYSMLQAGGTARSWGLGGATGALGADFSSMSNNPAGLGLYRGGEFIFTPTIFSAKTNSNYFGADLNAQATRFGFGSLGIIGTNNYKVNGKDVTKGWKSITWGFGFNKLASFTNNISYANFNNTTSIGDKYAYDLSGHNVDGNGALSYDPWGGGLAYNAWLLDANSKIDSTNYTAVSKGGKVNQSMDITERGAVNEMAMGLGGNYDERLFVGATLGIPFAKYVKTVDYSEVDDSSAHPDFKRFDLASDIKTSGTGINLKLGAIYKFNDYFRLGLAIHTPTYYSFSDVGNIAMTTDRDTSGKHEYSTSNTIKYTVYTPWRFVGSMAVMIQKYGFITVDYEYVDHSSSSLSFINGSSSDNAVAHDINKVLSKNYSAASNLRIGAEAKFDIFHVRAGYALYGSPYKQAAVSDYNQQLQTASIGAGIREKDYFFDITFMKSFTNGINLPYVFNNSTPSPAATLKTNKTMLSATVGFKF